MSTQILTVKNDQVATAKARAKARGATEIVEEDLKNGSTKLTITYPELPPGDDE